MATKTTITVNTKARAMHLVSFAACMIGNALTPMREKTLHVRFVSTLSPTSATGRTTMPTRWRFSDYSVT
jgi:hypothetical protein